MSKIRDRRGSNCYLLPPPLHCCQKALPECQQAAVTKACLINNSGACFWCRWDGGLWTEKDLLIIVMKITVGQLLGFQVFFCACECFRYFACIASFSLSQHYQGVSVSDPFHRYRHRGSDWWNRLPMSCSWEGPEWRFELGSAWFHNWYFAFNHRALI